jgi:hypothetical protein
MSWLISAKQYIPAVIGEAWGGGYFAGYISHTADGNPTHALIVAPAASGYSSSKQWKTTNTSTTGTASTFDGAANTSAIVAAGIVDHPAAKFCVDLNIGGYADWYLPSTLELDIAYFNLKPTTSASISSVGANSYAVPTRSSNYTAGYPMQTLLALFASSGSQAFPTSPQLWSSTEFSANIAFRNDFLSGNRLATAFGEKTASFGVRAFRRIAL